MLVISFIFTIILLNRHVTMSLKLPKLPSIFLFHGAGPGPLLDGRGGIFEKFDKNSPSTEFVRNMPRMIQVKSPTTAIKGIVVFSAHWEESKFQVDYQPGPTKLLYDYYGFPPETYAPHMTYPIKSDVKLAERIHNLLNEVGVTNVLKPREDGFDHGTFIPMKLAFPEANVPIVQVSLNRNLDIESHIRLGEALAPLRREGVLLVGSGAITHNLRALDPSACVDPRAAAFAAHMHDLLIGLNEQNYAERRQRLINVAKEAPYWKDMHPRAEHFIPLAVAFGTALPIDTRENKEDATSEPSMSVERVYHEIALGSLCADSYLFM